MTAFRPERAQRLALAGHGVLRFTHPAVQHMWLLGDTGNAATARADAQQATWSDNHPPIAERIRRIYGRNMPPLPPVEDKTYIFPH